MSRISLFPLVALGCISLPLLSQQAQPAPDSSVTIRSNSDLVLVDVTVDDSKHNPVHHLDASQFTILEDGHPQAIRFFEEHSAVSVPSKAGVSAQSVPKLPAGTFTNLTTAPADGALNILLIDKLNTPVTEQVILRDQVFKFLREMPAGRKLAIFVLTTRLSMLQGFTSDPEVLRAALSQINGKPKASQFLAKPITEDAGGDPLEQRGLEEELAADFLPGVVQSMENGAADFVVAQIQHRSDYTLDALNLLARYISTLQGRKNLIWLSGAFPVSILPDPGVRDPFSTSGAVSHEYRNTIDLLRRSQVAVYPIDVRGLKSSPVWSADSPVDVAGDTYRNPATLASDMNLYENTTVDERIGMNQMAMATGGRAYADVNDLKDAISSAIDSGSNYYTIAYSPTNRNWNGHYRKIDVQPERPGLTLAYRRGYYADPIQSQGSATESGDLQRSALHVAMQHGSPELSELTFQTEVRPSTDAVENSGARNNHLSKNFAGPYRRFMVTFSVNAGAVDCELKPDGTHQCEITFLSCLYDPEGALANDVSSHSEVGIPPDKYAEAPNRNFVFHQEISVPAKGEYYLRMGILDNNSGKLGTIEIPVAAVSKLPTTTASAAR